MTKTTVKIDGMMCGMCESHVCDAIRAAFDVKKVRASHKSGLLEIVTQNALDEGAVKKAIEPTGYTVLEVSSEPYAKKGLFGF